MTIFCRGNCVLNNHGAYPVQTLCFSLTEEWFAWCFDLLERQWQTASLRVQKAETKLETDDKQDAWFYSNCTAFSLNVGCWENKVFPIGVINIQAEMIKKSEEICKENVPPWKIIKSLLLNSQYEYKYSSVMSPVWVWETERYLSPADTILDFTLAPENLWIQPPFKDRET